MKARTLITLAAAALASVALAGEPTVKSPGKPRAAVSVRTDLPELVEGGAERTVRITARSLSACDDLVTTVHGTRGAVVQDGESRSHGPVAEGAEVVHPVRARIEPGNSGYVVVTSRCTVGGHKREVVETFSLSAKGASGQAPQQKRTDLGELTTDSQGRLIRVMPSTPQK